MKCSIVVATYNRPLLFKRVLQCVKNADYGQYRDIDLIISIDRAKNHEEMLTIANDFQWDYGKKRVIPHDKRLGLRDHFIFCGSLSQEYGPVIFLEDDVVVNKFFYLIAQKMTDYYENDDRIIGASLYSLSCNEGAFRMFYPIDDGSDVYFCSLMSWAPVYFPKQWKLFLDWLDKRNGAELVYDNIPENVRKWKKTSFKKLHIQFAAQNKMYFAYFRHSCATNFSEPGEHYKKRINDLQVSMLINSIDNLRLVDLDNSYAIYDCFMEIEPSIIQKVNPALSEYDFDVDLYGKKKQFNIQRQYVITTRKVRRSLMSFERSMIPHELNIAFGVEGKDIHLSKAEDVKFTKRGLRAYYKDALYDLRGTSAIKVFITDLVWFFGKIKQKFKRKQ